jgi:glucose/arabinose dehydrogenase
MPCVIVTLLAAGILLLGDCTARAQTTTDPTLSVVALSTAGLDRPTSMAFLAPDDILVLEKATGRVRRVLGGVLQPGQVLDVHVNSEGERGLLGIAINGESPPRVFLYYTEASGTDGGAALGNRVYAYTWNAGLAVLESPQLILELPIDSVNHNGGVVMLGPPGIGAIGDGRLLHVIIGDLGRTGQLQNHPEGAAPDDSSVILRVEQDGSPAAGNPFVPYCSVTTSQTCPGGGGCPGGETCLTQVARYFAYGVRNSFGLAIDSVTGALWQTENGPFFWDEVNLVAAGMNSGWNQIMGPDANDPQGVGDLFDMPGAGSTYSDPEFSWLDTNAPTGIVFPRGTTLGAAYDDVALIGDANNGFLYKFPLNGARTGFDFTAFPALQDLVANDTTEQNQLRIGQGFGVITDLEIGPDGDLYVVSHLPGQIFRISGGQPVCTPTPAICRTPAVGGRARILLKDHAADDAKDRLQWRWLKGAATDTTEFGDPINLHTYELCLYGGGSLVASATAPVDATCNGASCWRQSGRGFRYRNPTGTPDGLRTIILEAGGNGAARIVVQGKGAALAMPDLTTLASPLTVQLKRAGSTTCWGATYSFPPALRNDGAIFKDRAD